LEDKQRKEREDIKKRKSGFDSESPSFFHSPMPLKVYPVRNNAPLLPPGQRPSGPAAAAGLDFRIIPAGFGAPLELF